MTTLTVSITIGKTTATTQNVDIKMSTSTGRATTGLLVLSGHSQRQGASKQQNQPRQTRHLGGLNYQHSPCCTMVFSSVLCPRPTKSLPAVLVPTFILVPLSCVRAVCKQLHQQSTKLYVVPLCSETCQNHGRPTRSMVHNIFLHPPTLCP